MGLFQKKNSNRGAEDMEFPGALNIKQNVEILGVNTKRSGIYWGNPEEIMCNIVDSMSLGFWP